MPKRLGKKNVLGVGFKRAKKSRKKNDNLKEDSPCEGVFIDIKSLPKDVHSDMEVVHEVDNAAKIINTEPASSDDVDNVAKMMKTEPTSSDENDLPENLYPCEFVQLKEEPLCKEEYIEIKVSPDEVQSDFEVVHEIDNIAKMVKDEPVSSDEIDFKNNSDANKYTRSNYEFSYEETIPNRQLSQLGKHRIIGTKRNPRKKPSVGKDQGTTQANSTPDKPKIAPTERKPRVACTCPNCAHGDNDKSNAAWGLHSPCTRKRLVRNMNFQLYCFVCHKKPKDQAILQFTQERFEKCVEFLKIKRKFKLVYSDLTLPAQLSGLEGYHSECYKRFTALSQIYRNSFPKDAEPRASSSTNAPANDLATFADEQINVSREPQNLDENLEENEDKSYLVERASIPVEERALDHVESSLEHQVCILCNKARKSRKGRREKLHLAHKIDTLNRLKSKALAVNNIVLYEVIESARLREEHIFYHGSCKNQLESTSKSIFMSNTPPNDWYKKRDLNAIVLNKVCNFIEENVIRNNNCYLFSFVMTLYNNSLQREYSKVESLSEAAAFRSSRLEEYLNNIFKNKINIVTINKKKLVKPHGADLLPDDFEMLEKRDIIERAALILREEIRSIQCNKLPDNITDNNLIAGECPEVPRILDDFYISLLCGSNYKRKRSSGCQRLAKSLGHDLIYGVTNGEIKPSKHITLGLALKGLTNGKKVINIINRYGHCCSYRMLEELETESTLAACKQTDICPEDIIRTSNLCTGIAWNTFERFVDTTSGKDIVGIIFQDVLDSENNNHTLENARTDNMVDIPDNMLIDNDNTRETECSSANAMTTTKRSCDLVTLDLQPVAKKRLTTQYSLPANRPATPLNIDSFKHVNFAWMLSHALQIPKTPMWIGYNSSIRRDTSAKQKMSHLTTTNSSRTYTTAVKETMQQSMQAANECGQKYMQVTYDLTNAKIAMQIQANENDEELNFAHIFVHLGSFHIQLAYFKAVGEFIDNNGITNIMSDGGILAGRSINGFIQGKHFNRCKRLHLMVTLAIQILHFESFLNAESDLRSTEIKNCLADFTKEKSEKPMLRERVLIELFTKYEAYKKDTLEGKHGKTPRYYMIYVQLIDYFLMLSLSVRTGDFDLFMCVLPKIANLFFIFNLQNYSRCLIKYHDNLSKVNNTHPGLLDDFKRGSFGIKRTDNPCSRQPIDLTLEQTVNADAANKLSGISCATNSSELDRQRWCKGRSIRTKIISYVMEETGLRTKQDVTADLHENRIRKSRSQLQKLIRIIKESVNPFDGTLDEDLVFNISNGQVADDNVADFLLNVEKKGEELRNTFINECTLDEDRFDRSLKINKINNFTSLRSKNIVLQRDLFGQILGIALDKQLDIREVLTYPLTPIPFSLCHPDGSICKTEKGALLKLLEKEMDSNLPHKANVRIYDGFFFLHLMKGIPATYDSISMILLQMFLSDDAQYVIIVFDTYKSPSIKDKEHALRGINRGRKIEIRGSSTSPSDFSAELKNVTFKEDLIEYLLISWERKEMAPYFGNKIVYVNHNECYKYQVINDEVVKIVEQSQSCSLHEEADSKMIYHVCNFEEMQPPYNVVLRCADTDVLVIMLGNMKFVQQQVEVWMEVGVGKSQRIINVSKLYESLGSRVCDALPAFHALTGCDFNPAFVRMGKKRPFILLRDSDKYVDALTNLSAYPECNDEVFKAVEEFVCRAYGYKSINDVNEIRSVVFSKACDATNDEIFCQKVKRFDASAMPPCRSELREHVRRTAYISQIWSNAHLKELTNLSPLDCGWKVDENEKYCFNWFRGDQLPQSIDDITFDQRDDKDSETLDEFAEIFTDDNRARFLKENDGVYYDKDCEDEDSDEDKESDEESNISSDDE